MINKLQLQSIIDKYYLGLNESVKWVIKDKKVSIDFMTPTKDVIGNVVCDNFSMEDGTFSVKSDVWSLGVLFWEITTYCEMPYAAMVCLRIK